MTGADDVLGTIADRTRDLLGQFFGPVSNDAVFNRETDETGATVITAAAFERAGGFGWGGGGGNGPGGEDGGGGGAGGGGVTEGRPVAVIRITDDGVDMVPVVDVTKVAVTFLVAAAAVWRALR